MPWFVWIIVLFPFGLMGAAVPVLLVQAVAAGRRETRRLNDYAARRGWRFEDRRSRADECHWSGRLASGEPWLAIVSFPGEDYKSATTLFVNCADRARRPWTIPEPAGLRAALLDTDACRDLQHFYGVSLAVRPGDTQVERTARGLFGFARWSFAGPQFRHLVIDAPAQNVSGNWVLVGAADGSAHAALEAVLVDLDAYIARYRRQRPLILFGPAALILCLSESLEPGEDLDALIALAERLWAAAAPLLV